MNESELISRCLEKDKYAWNVFIQKYSRLIYWAIRKRLNASSFDFNEDELNNIFQEVFLSILEGEKLSQVKDAELISGWLAMVASNKTLDFMRQKIRQNPQFVFGESALKDDKIKEELYSRDLINIIKNTIDTLSTKEKLIISLNLLEDKTHQEIAAICGLAINTVSTIIARTKEKLKKRLEGKGVKNI